MTSISSLTCRSSKRRQRYDNNCPVWLLDRDGLLTAYNRSLSVSLLSCALQRKKRKKNTMMHSTEPYVKERCIEGRSLKIPKTSIPFFPFWSFNYSSSSAREVCRGEIKPSAWAEHSDGTWGIHWRHEEYPEHDMTLPVMPPWWAIMDGHG